MIENQRISPSLRENIALQQAPMCAQRGFSLIELIIVVALFGILSAFGVSTWTSYREASKLENAKGQIVALLQQARIKALSSGEKQTVVFNHSTDTVSSSFQTIVLEGINTQKFACSTCTASAASPQSISFKRRGSGTAASLKLSSSSSASVFYVTVAGITGRIRVSTQCAAGSGCN